jgi:signal transduction histidine kinase
MTVAFSQTGAVTEVEPMVGLALYRLVQESLANAARHAPGAPVTLSLAWQPDAVSVEVTNPLVATSSGPGAGHGLVGMRERVEQIGGEVVCGVAGDDWQIRATLPARAPTLEPR